MLVRTPVAHNLLNDLAAPTLNANLFFHADIYTKGVASVGADMKKS